MNYFGKKLSIKISLVGILFLIVFIFASHVEKAQAQLTVPTNSDFSRHEIAENAKNYWLDKAATVIAKQMLHQMTADIVGWINSGYKGGPAFLTNPGGFFRDTADGVVGDFISQAGPLKNLCSPWSLDIRLSLALQQVNSGAGSRSKYSCNLSTIIGNAKNAKINGYSIEGFLGGDFNQGGWDAFIALTTDSRNNPYSLYLTAYSDQLAAVGEKKAQISADLLQGSGFMSWESCEPAKDVQDEEGIEYMAVHDSLSRDSQGNLQRCIKKTPGSVIAGTLMPQLNSGTMELELADSINSVISAAVSQMLTQTLKKGLYSVSSGGSGLSNGAGSSRASLLSQVFQEATTAKNVNGASAANGTPAITAQTGPIYDSAIAAISPTKTQLETARTCYISKQTAGNQGGNQAFISAELTAINTDLGTANSVLSNLTSIRASITAAQNGTGAQGTTVGGTTNVNVMVNDLEDLGSDYLSNSSNFDGTSAAALPTVAQANADFLNAQSKNTLLQQNAISYQNSCNGL